MIRLSKGESYFDIITVATTKIKKRILTGVNDDRFVQFT